MGYIILNTDREDEMSGLRSNMRSRMRSGNYRHDGITPMMRHDDEKERMYEMGFRHGWEDAEDEHYRRQRDSRGRYI